MRKISTLATIAVYWLWLVIYLLPYYTEAHNLTKKKFYDNDRHKEQTQMGQPDFLSSNLFVFGKSRHILPPYKVEENIFTWQDAIAKGLPILKVGKSTISYNDFKKGNWSDSIKVEEGGVDCIRYKISRNTDSVMVGQEFELTIIAEYIDGIAYTLLNKESADFCIKVFMPEGFIATGGDYQDFEGFSIRPEGLRRIERKIKGYFTTKPENSCFVLTKGAKFYDPRYLLEVKQNYCFGLVDKQKTESFTKMLTKPKESELNLSQNTKTLEETPNTFNYAISDINLASCPTNEGWNSNSSWFRADKNGGLIYFCFKPEGINPANCKRKFKVRLVFSSTTSSSFPSYSSLNVIWHNKAADCCGLVSTSNSNIWFSAGKVSNTDYFEASGELSADEVNNGKHFDNICSADGKRNNDIVSDACEWGLFDIKLLNASPPTFTQGECNQTLTATCAANQVVVWTLPTGIPQSTSNISTIASTSQTYKAKCKEVCFLSAENTLVNSALNITPWDITESFNCNTRIASSYCPCGTIRWFYPNSSTPSYIGQTSIPVTLAGTYKVDCGFTNNQKSKEFGQYNAWGGVISEVSCGSPIKGYVYNSVDLSIFPVVIVTLSKDGESLSKEYQTIAGFVPHYRYFSMPYSDFSTFILGKPGTIEVKIEVKSGSCNVPVGTPRDLCCTGGTIRVINNAPLSVGVHSL